MCAHMTEYFGRDLNSLTQSIILLVESMKYSGIPLTYFKGIKPSAIDVPRPLGNALCGILFHKVDA